VARLYGLHITTRICYGKLNALDTHLSLPVHFIINFLNYFYRASADGRYVPNEGFYDDMVVEDPNFASASQHDSPEDPADGKQDKADADASDNQAGDPSVDSETIEDVTAGVNELNLPEEKTTEEPTEEKEHQHLSTEEIDSLLDKCLLQAIHTNVKDKDLPMPGSTLWYVHR
jgi:translation initiation factor 2D